MKYVQLKLKPCKELFSELALLARKVKLARKMKLARKVKSEAVHNKNAGVQEVFLTEEAGYKGLG